MKTEEALTIIEKIQEADLYSISFVTLVFLPILLAAWVLLLKNFELDKVQLKRFIYAIAGAYFLAIGVLKFGTTKDKEYEIASKKIKAYLGANGWNIIGYKRILQTIDNNYDSTFITELQKKYPGEFAVIQLADTTDPNGIKYLDNGQQEQPKYEVARDKIIRFLKGFPEGKQFSGFNVIRTYVDSRYDNYFLEELLARYPDSLLRTTLTDTNDFIGIKLPGS